MRGTKLGPHIEVPLPWVPAVKMLIVETLDHNRGKALNEQILSDWISKQMVTLCVTLVKKILVTTSDLPDRKKQMTVRNIFSYWCDGVTCSNYCGADFIN